MSNQEDNKVGGFLGFVLLSDTNWNREKLVSDMKEQWNIDISDDEEEDNSEYEDIIYANVEGINLAVSFMPAPVPNGEADHYAKANYMWEEASEVTASHKAQLLVAVLGDETDILERGKLFVKAVSCCLSQENAVAVYTDGTVFEPNFYRAFAEIMNDDELPIFNWVWFGIYGDEQKAGIYTYGLHKFGKLEIEVYVDREIADLNEIRDFLSSIATYVLEYDAELLDGQTIGFTEEQKISITVSDGIALDGKTIKLGY